MYCPNCGQQQPGTDSKFCSRCGFLMAGVTQLLASGGQPQIPVLAGPRGLTPRQRGQRMGAMMMLLTPLVVPIVAIITGKLHIMPALLIPLTAIILFIGGLLRNVYAGMFEESGPVLPTVPQPEAYIPAYMAPRSIVPPRLADPLQAPPVSTWQRPRNTAELATPPSVTENTTRL
jgi:hypothetical protein